MSAFDVGLLPSGHLHGFPSTSARATDNTRRVEAIQQAFSRSVGEGLFFLAAMKKGADLSPPLQYWRNFACQYMSERCLLPPANPPVAIEPFTATETTSLLLKYTAHHARG